MYQGLCGFVVYQTREREGSITTKTEWETNILSISDQREGGVYNTTRRNGTPEWSISDQREGGVYNIQMIY